MSSENWDLKISEILDRVGSLIKNHRLKAVAAALGADSSTASNWKMRGTIPWDALWKFANEKKVDFIWLLTGKLKQQAGDSDAAGKEDHALMDRYVDIIKHYEKIIEAQSKQIDGFIKQIDALTKAMGSEQTGRTHSKRSSL